MKWLVVVRWDREGNCLDRVVLVASEESKGMSHAFSESTGRRAAWEHTMCTYTKRKDPKWRRVTRTENPIGYDEPWGAKTAQTTMCKDDQGSWGLMGSQVAGTRWRMMERKDGHDGEQFDC